MKKPFKITRPLFLLFLLAPSIGRCQNISFIKSLNYPNSWVDSVMNTLSLKEKIGQVFMVRVYSDRDKNYLDSVAKVIKKERIGGLVFFSGGPVRQAIATNRFQKISKIPMLIAMDAEWGLGMRIDSVFSYPFQMALGAIQDNHLIYQMGNRIAADFKRIGMQMNFAPDMDINNNAANPVINYRSFGDQKINVLDKGLAYMNGMQDAGILTTAKHFPGHGDTNVDSHLNLPQLNFDLTRLDSLEEYPFKQAILSGVSGIMVAHMNIPALDSTKNLPSTLSKPIINDLLQKQLGFKGLIVSDAMNMKGVVKYFPDGEADLKAFVAGNDIIELSENTKRAAKKIKKSIKNGKLSIADLDQKVRKILTAKYWTGLNKWKPISTNHLVEDLNKPEDAALIQQLADASITLLVNNQHLSFPDVRKKTVIVNIGTKTSTVFSNNLSREFKIYETLFIDNSSTGAEIDSAFQKIESADQVIAGIYDTRSRPKSTLDFNTGFFRLIDKVASNQHSFISVFANPYTIATMPGIEKSKFLLACYQMSEQTQNAAANSLMGRLKTLGKLPVTINRNFKSGTGF